MAKREEAARKTIAKGDQIKRAFEQLKLNDITAAFEQKLIEKLLEAPSNDPMVVESYRVAIQLNRRYVQMLRGFIASGEISKKDLAAIEKASKVKKGLF